MNPATMIPYADPAPLRQKRSDSIRRMLQTRLSAMWRPPADTRESLAEVMHARTGTSVNTMTVRSETHTPSSVASWAVEEANGFMEGGGDVGGQQFFLSFDSTRIGFWILPEGGDATQGAASLVLDSTLAHTQAVQALAYDVIRDALGTQKDTIVALTATVSAKDKTIGEFMAAQMKYANEYAALQDNKHARDLENTRVERAEARKDMGVEKFVNLLDKATAIGGEAVMQKLAQKLNGPDPFEQLNDLLDPKEKEMFGLLIQNAHIRKTALEKRQLAEQASSTSSAPTPTSPQANGHANGVANGHANGAAAAAPSPGQESPKSDTIPAPSREPEPEKEPTS